MTTIRYYKNTLDAAKCTQNEHRKLLAPKAEEGSKMILQYDILSATSIKQETGHRVPFKTRTDSEVRHEMPPADNSIGL